MCALRPARWKRLLPLLLAAAVPAVASAQQPKAPPIPVGINVRPISAYDRGWVFVDAMKMASEWRYEGELHRTKLTKLGDRKDPTVLHFDQFGWPLSALGREVSVDFFRGARGHFPNGEFTVTWDGIGSVQFRGHSAIISQSPRRLVVDVDGPAGEQLGLVMRNNDLANPVRNIRVWLPGLEDSCHSFHPLFLERLRPFSVIRFYPWMKVYSSSGRWENRTTMRTARQGGPEGVAAEYMVDLCNELVADPWFCIPHTADDDYVRNFATLVRESLHSQAKIYVEFSNETWNTDFLAGIWARAQGQKLGVPAMQVVGERAAEVFDIWYEVFGERKDRIVRVAGVQLHNPGIATIMTRHMKGKYDALALGTYFGARPDRDPVSTSSTAAELMTVARENIDRYILPRINDHRVIAQSLSAELGRHISLVTYEGGQSIVSTAPGGGLNVQATLQCQNMPEMYTAYRALIEGAQALGVELFVGYDFAGARTHADTFSVLEYIDQPTTSAPKYRALIEGWESRGQ